MSIYQYTREEVQTIHSSVAIHPGEVWENDQGYQMEILDTGESEIWCRWQNGHKGHWDIQKFMDGKYRKIKEAVKP